MTLTDDTKTILSNLLADNEYICGCFCSSLYAKDEQYGALIRFRKNTELIKDLLGIQVDYRKQEAQHLARVVKDAEENKEHIEAFTSVIKDTFEDIKNPSVDRVYKFNPEKEGKFEVSIEERSRTTFDPFAELRKEPNATKEEWDAAMKSQEEYFEEDYEQRKKWYAEAIADPSKFDWAPVSWRIEPTKNEIIYDEEILSMTKGFMVGPVGLYNGRCVAAETQKYDNLAEMQIFLKVQAKTKDMVTYMAFKQDKKFIWRGTFVERDEKKINQTELLAQDIHSVLGSDALKEFVNELAALERK
jgi:hypothetical protein